MTQWPESLIPCYSILKSLLGAYELRHGFENFTWSSFTRKSFVDIQTRNIANYSDIGKCLIIVLLYIALWRCLPQVPLPAVGSIDINYEPMILRSL